ncbi:MAG: chitobiase/beta-hexosaminidase C-terminal domain-containing protein [Planctomycetes bacterium]|nr:chitobiase/beta-hexosaminidase C-terminal domain-containing protein [Planctomycetota bacterium]
MTFRILGLRPIAALLLAATALAGESAMKLDLSGLTSGNPPWEKRDRIALLTSWMWDNGPVLASRLDAGFLAQLPRHGISTILRASPNGNELVAAAENLIRAERPTIVFLVLGWKDICEDEFRGRAPTAAVFANNLAQMLDVFDRAGVLAVLGTPPPKNDRKVVAGNVDEDLLEAYAESVRAAAAERGLTVCDLRKEIIAYNAANNLADSETGVLYWRNGKFSQTGITLATNLIAKALGRAVATSPLMPWIPILDGGFTGQVDVPIVLRHCANPDGVEIRFTTDGKPVGPLSRTYDKPFRIGQDTTVKVLATSKSGGSNHSAEFRLTDLEWNHAVKVAKPKPGLRYEFFLLSGDRQRLPDFLTLIPNAEGVCPGFELDLNVDNKAIAQMQLQFAVSWRGFVEVPLDDIYTFHLSADDGARLSIDAQVVVDNDGSHLDSIVMNGQIALKAGLHPCELQYYQRHGGMAIRLDYESAVLRKQPVPQAALWYDPAENPRKREAKTEAKKN